jgi:UDP-N-acetylmuramyl pentapeptide phosphotransferase/UDP-N-acetylglucosamine-1-phosphate transferase
MHALPLVFATLIAVALAPALMRAMVAGGQLHANYRGRRLPFPLGVLAPLAATLALAPLMLIARLAPSDVFHPEVVPVAIYGLGIALLGLIDDTLGEHPQGGAPGGGSGGEGGAGLRPPRGWRGHTAAVLRGELSTGALKAAGSVGLALLAVDMLGRSDGRWLLAAAVVVLATNVFNLLDLRPGRAMKAFVALGAGLVIGSGELRTLWTLGLLAGPALVAGAYDLREKAMLGDTGSNLLGALAGLWLVLTLSGTGQLIALVVLLAITVYGELRSISELIERTPGLRELDSWGRPS